MFDTPFDKQNDDRDREAAAAINTYDKQLNDAWRESVVVDDDAPRRSRKGLALLGIFAALLAGWWFLRGEPTPAAEQPIPTVAIATPLQQEVTEWDDFIGRFEASRSVEIRPRVSGQITRVHFSDGQFVRAGAPLFTIDARPYSAALAEAHARVASVESALALSRSNLERARRLIEEDAVAANEIDRLEAEVRANQASLAAARAAVRSRALDVEFTTVRAPISGRISDRRVDAGNLVAAGGGDATTLLTTINAIDPIYFSFEGSEAMFLRARREGLDGGTPIEIRLADEGEYRWNGTLDFTDNALDQRSGTIRARAVVRNGEGFLTPGLFGNMRMATGGTYTALLVPDTSITTDQTRKLLLVVDNEGIVVSREVELGPLVDGLRVIRSGIDASDRVIISGLQMAAPGQKVNAQNGQIQGADTPTAPAADG